MYILVSSDTDQIIGPLNEYYYSDNGLIIFKCAYLNLRHTRLNQWAVHMRFQEMTIT